MQRRSLAALGINSSSLRYRDGALLLKLRQIEKRRKRIEWAEHDQLLQVEPAINQGDEIALLGGQIEAIEVRQKLGAELRNGLHSLRNRQEVAHDRVA